MALCPHGPNCLVHQRQVYENDLAEQEAIARDAARYSTSVELERACVVCGWPADGDLCPRCEARDLYEPGVGR